MAISVLEGGGDSRISKQMALSHDRPLRGRRSTSPCTCVSGYYNVAADGAVKLVTDPEAAKGLPSDKGGNVLFFGPGPLRRAPQLLGHTLPTKVTGTDDHRGPVKALEPKVAAQGAVWKSAGDYHHWAEGWATESLVAARTAYEGIVFGASTPDPKGGILSIKITLPPDYDAACTPGGGEAGPGGLPPGGGPERDSLGGLRLPRSQKTRPIAAGGQVWADNSVPNPLILQYEVSQ
jgi:hypothetical protein